MSDPSIFNQNTDGSNQNQNPNGTGNPNTQGTNPLETMLAGIRNERGEQKYKSVEDALKALQHSQEYIPTLRTELEKRDQELASLRTEVEKINTLQATVESLTRSATAPATPAAPVVSEEVIADVVQRTLSKAQVDALRSQNLGTVVSKLRETYGNEAEAQFYTKAAEVGLSKAEVNDLAAKSPSAVFRLLGMESSAAKPNTPATPSSSINTSGLTPPVNTTIKRNDKTVLLGATSSELAAERQTSIKMIDELAASGKSVYDLTDPKEYFKHFG